ncbi:MAG: hypothetical protein ABJC61_09275 [Acidobacteriota bacterium]
MAGWVLGAVLLIGLIFIVRRTMRRRTGQRVSIYERTDTGSIATMPTKDTTTTVKTTTGNVPLMPRS